jgi:hypothetical protein
VAAHLLGLCLVSVGCCRVEVSASGWSLFQRRPTDCGVSECYREVSIMKRSWPIRDCCIMRGERERTYCNTTPMWLNSHDNGTAMFVLTQNKTTSMFLNAALVRLCSVTRHCCDILTDTNQCYFYVLERNVGSAVFCHTALLWHILTDT